MLHGKKGNDLCYGPIWMHSEMTEDFIMYRRAPADIKPK